jgi:hypothetical protein
MILLIMQKIIYVYIKSLMAQFQTKQNYYAKDKL